MNITMSAVLRAATATVLGGILLAGDFAGTATSPVAAKINGATVPAAGALVTGHVLQASGVSATTYGYVANANIDAAAAIAGTKIAPDFGAQNLVTTGYVGLGTTRASTGDLRGTKTFAIRALKADDTTVVNIASVASSVITYGGTANDGLILGTSTGNTIAAQVNGSSVAVFDATGVTTAGVLRSGSTSGTAMATTGAVRVASAGSSGDTVLFSVRNNAQGANIEVLNHIGSNDEIRIGPTSGATIGTLSLNPNVSLVTRVGGTTRFSCSTSAFTYSVPVVLQGSNPSTTGDIRFAAPTGTSVIIGFRNNALTADATLIAYDTSNRIYLGGANASTVNIEVSATTRLSITSSGITVTGSITTSVSSSTQDITHATKTSDAAPGATTITSQAPFATATGANRVPGDLVLAVPAPTNSGTTRGKLTLKNDGTNIVELSKDTSGNNTVRINYTTQTTVGAAGGASGLPLTPTGYAKVNIGGTDFVMPYYAAA